jgi:uracil-DNA glycosylase family 4
MRVRDGRQQIHDNLANRIRTCTKCDGMNVHGVTQSSPGYGSLQSPVVVVGQSLCGPCMKEQQPLFGGSGKLLDKALETAGRTKEDIYTTNVVHCHPPQNQKSLPAWIDSCTPYLREEFEILQPCLAIGFGDDAHDALQAIYPDAPILSWPLTTVDGIVQSTRGNPALLFPPHPGSSRWIPTADGSREKASQEWVICLARAVKWGFHLEPTCTGMADGWMTDGRS